MVGLLAGVALYSSYIKKIRFYTKKFWGYTIHEVGFIHEYIWYFTHLFFFNWHVIVEEDKLIFGYIFIKPDE